MVMIAGCGSSKVEEPKTWLGWAQSNVDGGWLAPSACPGGTCLRGPAGGGQEHPRMF